MNGYSVAWKSSVDQLVTSIGSVGLNDGGGNAAGYKQLVVTFEGEPVERLEKQEIAFKLIAHILDKVFIDTKLLDQVMIIAKEQLQSMSAFLKIRKNDWNEQGTVLKARINTKLSVFQAAASSLLSGITQIAITRGGQLLCVLLIRLKPLVLATCAQTDTWGNSQGAMFESVLKTSCEIIEFGWSKDRSPVDSFIMGLATSIRERNDYEEEIFSHMRNEEDMHNAEEIRNRKNSHDFLGKLSGLEQEDKDFSFSLLPSTLVTTIIAATTTAVTTIIYTTLYINK
ncbi:Phosphatidylinositol 4-kinase alpha 1 [Camellia lanceoleosa]|uniref:Phosphatidylinositol 4-kinase alpha 1 n=1 Tax=Camellia lanceoleosa TaxID=1840588 RepID=A0ACC0IRY7_9ERIC|nr:Phosphatidylinositol 4-kinase alpha 1 [Camellia lanceoleosa]